MEEIFIEFFDPQREEQKKSAVMTLELHCGATDFIQHFEALLS